MNKGTDYQDYYERISAKSEALFLTFDDFVIQESGADLLAECDEEEFFLEPLALIGQMTMVYAPPGAAKTLILLNLARAFQCRSISSMQTTKTNER